MDTDEVSTAESVKPSNVTKRPKTVSEVESLMQEVHSRMPAWKATKILEIRKASQVDLAALGEATGILFESQDMLSKAVLYLDRLRKKKTNEEDADLDTSGASDSQGELRCEVQVLTRPKDSALECGLTWSVRCRGWLLNCRLHGSLMIGSTVNVRNLLLGP